MTQTVSLSRVHFPVTALGPGRRLGIWFQGCGIRCPGCVSADTWGPGRRRIEVEALLADIVPWLAEADGVTVSGGEPFEQFDALRALLSGIRARSGADILVYSGHEFEQLQPMLAGMPGLVDVLISGPYRQAEPQTLPLRGSDNQRLHRLTALGEQRFAGFDAPRQGAAPTLDVMFDADGSVWMAGIPRPDDLKRLRAVLETAGHHARTSQHNPGAA
ncbi:4Fe-4S single cluster domain-containing protein [Marilutibacter alkalisoli]|uniref:Radical SAM protein n=1 Tax=Marilutibacter alkalisoli TaxID=2591633 RepID=A0A514BNE6_9GAMM|nr:4Fe-4S single cluster domain-containing protein [Lysobacter alkalisoli]QDH68914.1 radical SAM protein [Lysobacter alkalisoli]